MATSYKYQNTDIAGLTAKSSGESLTGVSYINPKSSDYKSSYSGEYRFIPYSTSILGGLWASKKASFKDAYKSSSSNDVKIENTAAWGSAPIPKRLGLSNTDSIYINTRDHAFDTTTPDIFEWDDTNKQILITNSVYTKAPFITTEPCPSVIVVDVVARGGNGGSGYKAWDTIGGHTRSTGGAGGGSGAMASLLIDMSKAKKVTFDNTAEDNTKLRINLTNGYACKLGNGGNGEDGASNDVAAGGSGGIYEGGNTGASSFETLGVKVLWHTDGTSGAAGSHGQTWVGGDGGDGPSTITFIDENTVSQYAGGTGGGCADDDAYYYCWGGGGGGASIFAKGGNGGNIDYSTGTVTNTNANYGAGGGGGYVYIDDGGAAAVITGRNGSGGGAFARFYFESTTTSSYTTSSSGDDSGGGSLGGCVFPGTQIALDKDISIDIVDFKPKSSIDFCNPDTLEHMSQQTLAKLVSNQATKKIVLWLEDGKTLELTPDHAVLTEEGFKTYETTVNMFPLYSVGEKLATVDGYKKIISIQEENIDATKVYNIITENSLMVANGIIVAGELNYNIDPSAINDSIIEKDLQT